MHTPQVEMSLKTMHLLTPSSSGAGVMQIGPMSLIGNFCILNPQRLMTDGSRLKVFHQSQPYNIEEYYIVLWQYFPWLNRLKCLCSAIFDTGFASFLDS